MYLDQNAVILEEFPEVLFERLYTYRYSRDRKISMTFHNRTCIAQNSEIIKFVYVLVIYYRLTTESGRQKDSNKI